MKTRSSILLVDDEEEFTGVVSALLSSQGFKVEVANSGDAALDLLKSGVYDLLITDLNMPVMNGIQLIREVRTFDLTQRIIVVTGFPSQKSYEEVFNMGISNYIPKPFLPDHFLSLVKEALN